MPAIMIRQLDALTKIIEQTPDRARRTVLNHQAEAIQRSNLATVADPTDRDDVTQRYETVVSLLHPKATPTCSETYIGNRLDSGAGHAPGVVSNS
jgi:uncharacterized membrane protein